MNSFLPQCTVKLRWSAQPASGVRFGLTTIPLYGEGPAHTREERQLAPSKNYDAAPKKLEITLKYPCYVVLIWDYSHAWFGSRSVEYDLCLEMEAENYRSFAGATVIAALVRGFLARRRHAAKVHRGGDEAKVGQGAGTKVAAAQAGSTRPSTSASASAPVVPADSQSTHAQERDGAEQGERDSGLGFRLHELQAQRMQLESDIRLREAHGKNSQASIERLKQELSNTTATCEALLGQISELEGALEAMGDEVPTSFTDIRVHIY